MSEKDMVISERYLRSQLNIANFRADAAEAKLAAAQRTIEAQAAELNNVRNLIDRQLNAGYISFTDRVDDMRRWLDTHPEVR